jgi:hypothetical protein
MNCTGVLRRRLPSVVLAALILAVASPAEAADPFTTTVVGEVTDASAVTISVNGVPATVTGSSYTAPDVPLSFGMNTLTVTATDAAGNVASASVAVRLDAECLIQGTASDLSAVTVSVNGKPPVPVVNGQWSAAVPLQFGLNTLTAVATDAANHQSSTQSTVFAVHPPVEHP